MSQGGEEKEQEGNWRAEKGWNILSQWVVNTLLQLPALKVLFLFGILEHIELLPSSKSLQKSNYKSDFTVTLKHDQLQVFLDRWIFLIDRWIVLIVLWNAVPAALHAVFASIIALCGTQHNTCLLIMRWFYVEVCLPLSQGPVSLGWDWAVKTFRVILFLGTVNY